MSKYLEPSLIANIEGDVKEVLATLPGRDAVVFRVAANGRAYIKGTTRYYDNDQFDLGIENMRLAGAEITEKML